MLLLIIFAFLGGIITILSPCILAVLPIILSGATGGRGRPWGVVAGFVSGFTFFTLFLTTIVGRLGIPAEVLRYFAIAVLTLFGMALVVPWIQLRIEILFSRLAARAPQSRNRTGFSGGILLGLSLGLLWTPCVGPILASVISLALTGSVTGNAVLIILSYALGTALPMLAIMAGGRGLVQKVPWLTGKAGRIQQAFGVLMILTALAIVFNADKKFQAYMAEKLPDYVSVLTSLERNERVTRELDRLEGRPAEEDGSARVPGAVDSFPLAPELKPGGEWFNSEGLTLKSLRGQVVLVDFMTYSCINCIRTFPHLNAWHEEYRNRGLTIIGVHTPEFEFEKNAANVHAALKNYGIKFAVVQDNAYATWRAFGNRYWPRKYLIDHQGRIVYDHIGEGKYEETEAKIRVLLAARDQELKTGLPALDRNFRTGQIAEETSEAISGEVYFGAARNEHLAGAAGREGEFVFTEPDEIEDDMLYLVGRWLITPEYAEARMAGARVIYRYNARRVFMVAGCAEPAGLSVRQDNALLGPSAGADVSANGQAGVSKEMLYRLVENPQTGIHTLELTADAPGIKLFTFTFG